MSFFDIFVEMFGEEKMFFFMFIDVMLIGFEVF